MFLPYQRCAFTTRMPTDRLFTPGHAWLERSDDGWRVGLTSFATRMLGEAVSFGFDTEPGARVERGQAIGWIEGFKAISELYAPLDGTFLGPNPTLPDRIEAVTEAPFYSGWLYRIEGEPPPDAMDVHGYASMLDGLIDHMARARSQAADASAERTAVDTPACGDEPAPRSPCEDDTP